MFSSQTTKIIPACAYAALFQLAALKSALKITESLCNHKSKILVYIILRALTGVVYMGTELFPFNRSAHFLLLYKYIVTLKQVKKNT